MEILELELQHYGKFENHRMALKPGVNIIYGGNESGKSTIHSFVRAMLFGMDRGQGETVRRGEYQLRKPWDAPSDFSGSMTVRENGCVYRIERNFDSRAAELTVWNVTRDCQEEEPEGVLAGLLGGIGEAAFVNTVFLAQSKVETDGALVEELRRCIANGKGGIDAQIDVTAALQGLRKKKRRAEREKQEEEALLESQIREKQRDADYLRREMDVLTRELDQLRCPELEEDQENGGDSRQPAVFGGTLLQMLLLLAGLLALSGAVALTQLLFRIVLGVAGVLFLGLLYPVRRYLVYDGAEENRAYLEWTEEDRRQAAYLEEEIVRCQEAYRKLQVELEQLCRSQVRAESVETEIAALNLAIDRICELSVGISGETEEGLASCASRILKQITCGRYDRIVMDETGEIRIHTPDRVLSLEQAGSGTLQQIYFAVRVAAGEMLGKGSLLPLILDEPFALYDDKRLEAVLGWLHQSGRQVLLFTCQKRERTIMNRVVEGKEQ